MHLRPDLDGAHRVPPLSLVSAGGRCQTLASGTTSRPATVRAPLGLELSVTAGRNRFARTSENLCGSKLLWRQVCQHNPLVLLT